MEYAFAILKDSKPLPVRASDKPAPAEQHVAQLATGICSDAASFANNEESVTAAVDIFTFLVMVGNKSEADLVRFTHAEQKLAAAEVLAKTSPNAGGKRYDVESLKSLSSVSLALFAWYPTLFAATETEKELEKTAAELEAVADTAPGAEAKRMELRARHGMLYDKLKRLLKDSVPATDEVKKEITFDEKEATESSLKMEEQLAKLTKDLARLEDKNRPTANNDKIPDLLAPVAALAKDRALLEAEVSATLEMVAKLSAAPAKKAAATHVDPAAGGASTTEQQTAAAAGAAAFTLSMPGLVADLHRNWKQTIDGWKTRLAECEAAAAKFASEPAFAEMLGADARKALVDFAPVKSSIAACEASAAGLQRTVDEAAAEEGAFQAGFAIFDRERKLMLQWCRQQRTNLDAIVDPDELQEFCASLLGNHNVMERNVIGLLEMAEPPRLLPRAEVQVALAELSEVWLHLHVSAMERLQRELIEIHDTSRLEDEVRAFAPYSQKAKAFLADFQKLLTQPADNHSRLLMQPMVSAVEELQAEGKAHEGLSTQLSEFVNTMEGLRGNYLNFRRAVLSRVTFLHGTAPTISASLRRRDEYARRLTALGDWVNAKSRGERWSTVRGRLERLQSMIDSEIEMLKREAAEEVQQDAAAAAAGGGAPLKKTGSELGARN